MERTENIYGNVVDPFSKSIFGDIQSGFLVGVNVLEMAEIETINKAENKEKGFVWVCESIFDFGFSHNGGFVRMEFDLSPFEFSVDAVFLIDPIKLEKLAIIVQVSRFL